MSNYDRNNDYEDYEDNSFDYTQDEQDSMYREAFEGEPDAYWNCYATAAAGSRRPENSRAGRS